MYIGNAVGGQNAAGTILKAAELAGEAAFPLTTRWLHAGEPILDGLLSSEFNQNEIPPSLSATVDAVVRMLKGMKVVDPTSQSDSASSTIIMSGPAARGGRARSYSFGKSEGLNFLQPYPKEMYESLVSILSKKEEDRVSREVRTAVYRTILCSNSWGKGVFRALRRDVRLKIASAVLLMATRDADGADEALFSLPLEAADVAELLGQGEEAGHDLAAITYLADFASSNSQRLTQEKAASALFSAFFECLSALSSETSNDNDAVDYGRQSLLTALLELTGTLPDGSVVNLPKEKSFNGWISLLITLIAGDDKSHVRKLESIRGKRACLSLLTSLCERYPLAVAKELIPATIAIVSSTESQKDATIAAECFALVVPVYFKHSSAAKLSPVHLLNAFVASAVKATSEDVRTQLFQGFADAFGRIAGGDTDDAFSAVGALVAASLAGVVHCTLQNADEGSKTSSLPHLAQDMLRHASASTKISAVGTLVSYVKELVTSIMDGENSFTSSDILSAEDLAEIARDGPRSDISSISKRRIRSKNKQVGSDPAVLELCTVLLVAVCETVATPGFRRIVRHTEGDSSTLILRLWQDLLLVQSACHNRLGGNFSKIGMGSFCETIGEITNETLDSVQSHLPSHIFLAFATNLVKEGGTEELRARAVQLIADRALALSPSDPEAALFRDMLPFLVGLLKVQGGLSSSMDDDRDGKILQQSALVAIESVARGLCLSAEDTKAVKSHTEQFASATTRCAELIIAESRALKKSESAFTDILSPSRQLVCSAALCVATTFRLSGPRGLPALQKLMTPLLAFLSASNDFLGTSSNDRVEEGQAKLMQLSILRCLSSVAETLPQFLAPFLGSLLEPSVLPSEWLRKDVDEQALAVKTLTERFDSILASRVPARQLIPAASSSLVGSKGYGGVHALLSILTNSVKESKGAELSSQVKMIVNAATFVFDHGSTTKAGESLVDASNELLLALVLKLSEVQLRSLYARLREWRGDLDQSNPQESAARRAAFWGVSSCLGKQLKSIYLPCFSTVFSDAVGELVSICEVA
jgi:hypothetical protein